MRFESHKDIDKTCDKAFSRSHSPRKSPGDSRSNSPRKSPGGSFRKPSTNSRENSAKKSTAKATLSRNTEDSCDR